MRMVYFKLLSNSYWRRIFNLKIIILGATGMLGHKLMQVLSDKFLITGTMRGETSDLSDHPVFSDMKIIGNIRADDLRSVHKAIDTTEPDVVINCIGIVKQLPAAQDPLQSIAINALFPHQLAQICQTKEHPDDPYEYRLCIFRHGKGTILKKILPMPKISMEKQNSLGRLIIRVASPSAHQLSVGN